MKKRVLSLLLVLALCLSLVPGAMAANEPGDIPINEANFPDAAFRTFIQEKYDTDGNAALSPAEVTAAERLCAFYPRSPEDAFHSIEGISYLTNLKSVTIAGHALQKADFSALTNLHSLNLSSNGITDLTLPQTISLRELEIYDEPFKSLDLAGCQAIDTLSVAGCGLEGTTEDLHLRNLSLLTALDLDGNHLTYADLTGLELLEAVSLSDNKISEIRMGLHPNLIDFNFSSNPVRSVDVSSLPAADITFDLWRNEALELIIPAEGVNINEWWVLTQKDESSSSYSMCHVASIEGGTLDEETGDIRFSEGSDEIRLRLLDSNASGRPDPCFEQELVLKKDNEVQVQFRVGNGTWADGTDTAIQVSLPMTNGRATLPADCVPTGMLPWENFGSGAWTPPIDLEENALTKDVQYAYVFSYDPTPTEAGIRFEVVNGTWSDGSTEAMEVTVPLKNGEGYIPADQIPAASRLNEDFEEEAAWSCEAGGSSLPVTTPIHEMKVTGDAVLRCTFQPRRIFRVTPQLLIGGGKATLQAALAYFPSYITSKNISFSGMRTDGIFMYHTYDLPDVTGNLDFVTEDQDENGRKFQRSATVTVLASDDAEPFTDVSEDSWYRVPVLWAYAGKIASGVRDGIFDAKQECTRAQIVTFLWRAADCPAPIGTENPFTDINADDWFYDAALWAVENGITTGFQDGSFRPYSICTRAQAVTFLYRANGEPSVSHEENPFPDLKGEWYLEPVLWAVENGITTGLQDGTFAPDGHCTRAQIVTFLYRSPRHIA